MTDQTINNLITAIPPTLVALLAFYQGIRNGWKADANGKALAENTQKTDAITEKVEAVHELTNSNLTSANDKADALATDLRKANERLAAMDAGVKADLATAQQQIADLMKLVVKNGRAEPTK
jgi:conjugal transfer/entry exclusion protein